MNEQHILRLPTLTLAIRVMELGGIVAMRLCINKYGERAPEDEGLIHEWTIEVISKYANPKTPVCFHTQKGQYEEIYRDKDGEFSSTTRQFGFKSCPAV